MIILFSFFEAFAIMFCYFNQLTLFCGFLVLHSNRIKANRNSLIWCIKHKVKNDFEFEMVERQNADIKPNSTKNLNTNCFLKHLRNLSDRFKSIYKFLLTKKIGKIIVGIIFIIYISFSSYQALRIGEGLEIGNLVADKSYFRSYIMENFEEFQIDAPVMMIINEPLDYTNKLIRERIDTLLTEAREINGMNKDFTINWINYFNEELKEFRKNDRVLERMINDRLPFSNDIVVRFNQTLNQSQIIASRFYVKYNKTTLTSEDARVMNDLLRLCSNSGLPIKPYAIGFKVFEQFEQTIPNTVQAFVIAAESMYFISLIFIPDLISAICIILSMMSIMIGMVGFMHVWSLSLNSITMIEVIMSVGFCIDFTAHLTHAFIAGVGTGSRNERAYRACLQTGVPILNSALSTIIGVCVLGLAESYAFITFFKTLILVMVLGVFTSMLFLPVLLSLIGPHWSFHKAVSDKTNKNPIKPLLIE